MKPSTNLYKVGRLSVIVKMNLRYNLKHCDFIIKFADLVLTVTLI